MIETDGRDTHDPDGEEVVEGLMFVAEAILRALIWVILIPYHIYKRIHRD